MEVLDFEPGMLEEWDAFVAAHPLAGYGHLAANFALAAATPGLRNTSLVVREGRTLVGVLPLFEQASHTLRAVPMRSFTSGAFFPAGPLLAASLRGKAETNALTLLLDGACARARTRRIDRIVIGYPNITAGQPTVSRLGYSPLLQHGYRARPAVGLMLDLTRTEEQLGSGRRSGCRQTIAKAQSSGATTAVIRDRETWLEAYGLNLQTLGDLALSRDQMAVIWDRFIAAGHATAYGVLAGGALVAVTTTIQCNGAVYYWHGWRAPGSVNGGSHLGLWTAILAARESGCRAFELGSLEFENAKNIGISQFKQSFGGVPFQTMSAQLDLKPVKAAAVALAEAVLASVKRRRHPAAAPSPAPPLTEAAAART